MDELPQPDKSSSEPQLLGGNIELSGFRALDAGSMIVLKKIIGNYARKFSDQHGGEKLALALRQESDNLALSGTVLRQGSSIVAEHAEKNIFVLVDTVLKKLENQLISSTSLK